MEETKKTPSKSKNHEKEAIYATPKIKTITRSSSFSEENGSAFSQSRDELIERYEFLADQYEASLNERDQLKKQKRSLELEIASINQQQARLKELLESLKSEQESKPEDA